MIRVKHDASAAAIGGTAYTIGRGEKRRWATDIALKEQALGLQAASIAASSEARAGQLALQKERQDFAKEQWQDEPARQLERGLQQQKLLQSKVAYEYTESQKRRRAQVIEGLNWLQQRDDWTPEQKEDAAQQLWGIYHRIIPGPVDVGPEIQERFESGWVTDETTGERWREQPDGKFEKEGMTEAEWGKDYDNSFKTLASAMDFGTPTTNEVLKHMKAKREGYAIHQGLAKKTQEEKMRLQQKAVQDLKAIEEQEAITERAEMERDVASLPRQFEEEIEGPKIGRIGGGKPRWTKDDVFGEEAYNNLFLKVSGEDANRNIPPEVIKAELDKWWLARYEEHKGKRTQTYQNPMEFEGAAREADYGQRADGTSKGTGFFGELALQGGGVATEYSIGVEFDGKETQIPTLVPTLTKDELTRMLTDIIPNKKEIPKAIVKKAIDHAKRRMKQGKSPFAEPGEATQETGKVKMRAPNGEIYEVDRSEAEEAKKHGWMIF